ncbi:MAG: hypothetical protein QOI83_3964, partial [Streptomycetaceae bacterium]|nr:hypothetical protein [Streptomycetaceae bacterium]
MTVVLHAPRVLGPGPLPGGLSRPEAGRPQL